MSGKRIQKKWKGMAGGVLSVLLTGSLFLTAGTVFAMDDPEAPEEIMMDAEAETLTESAVELPGETEEIGTEAAAETATEADPETGEEVETKGLCFASDLRDVYDALLSAEGRYYYYMDDVLDYAVEESAASNEASMTTGVRKAAADTSAAAGEPVSDFSTTNLRDANVDEADIVKTDGSYIYILRDSRYLMIVRADGENSEFISQTDLLGENEDTYDHPRSAKDMYVDGEKLIIVFSGSDRVEDESWAYNWKDSTVAATFDISDPGAPAFLGSVRQDGTYLQSRKVGDKVFLYSTQYVNVYGRDYEDCKEMLLVDVNGEKIPTERYCIPDYVTDSSYLIVSSFSTETPDEVIDSLAMVSGAENVYVTPASLYVMNRSYEGRERTEIVKFSFGEDGSIQGKASAMVRGTINDTFSIDEYDGNLRVLTTYMGSDTGAFLEALSELFGLDYYADDHWVRHNALYILDENLRRRSKLSDIAKNEEVRSARYFGDTVYFVTFENTDPLFTADLSDPDKPKLTGELKISGFSSYLHPYGEGLLLGIGYEADEDTGRTTGLKLSMFDVSDPANVKELDRFVIDGITWCPAIEDYKAILADGGKNLIGFFIDDRYMVFNYAMESGFERILLYDFYEDMLNGNTGYDRMRGLYIGDELYLAGENYVVGFDMSAPEGLTKNLVIRADE